MSINGQVAWIERVVPDIQGLPRPFFARNESLLNNTQTAWHQHPWVQVSYAIKGMLTVYTESGNYVAPPMWAVWIPPHTPHRVLTSDHVEMRGLYIDTPEALPHPIAVLEVNPLLRELINVFSQFPVNYAEQGDEGRLVQVMFDQLQQARTAELSLPMPTDPRLQRLCLQLQQQPDTDQTLAQWGMVLGASEKTLSRLFVKQTGLTFRLWRQRLRLLSALRYLESGEKVTSVALKAGYHSTSAFIAAFREQFGMTPGGVFHE